jgi:hypothetical protein
MSLLKKEDLKQCMDTFQKPFMYIIYSEAYPYIRAICFYNIILIFIALVNLILLSLLYMKIK